MRLKSLTIERKSKKVHIKDRFFKNKNTRSIQGPQKLSLPKSLKIQITLPGIFTLRTISNGFLIKYKVEKERPNRSTTEIWSEKLNVA